MADIESKDNKKLAELSRLSFSPEEEERIKGDLAEIISYVSTISEMNTNERATQSTPNVFREDEQPHEEGVYTEVVLGESALREGDSVGVKKIIEQ